MQDTAMASSTWSGQEGLIHLLGEHRVSGVSASPFDYIPHSPNHIVPVAAMFARRLRGLGVKLTTAALRRYIRARSVDAERSVICSR